MEHTLDKKLRALDAKKIGAQIKVLETEIEIKKVSMQMLLSDEYQNKDIFRFMLHSGKPIKDIVKKVDPIRVKIGKLKTHKK